MVLSIVQGLTEFLPISSSGHLLLLPRFFGWADQGLNFDAAIHLGTLLAVLVYFHRDLRSLIASLFDPESKAHRKLVALLLLSAIPAVIAGLTLKTFIEEQVRGVLIVAVNLLIWGIILMIAEYTAQHRQTELKMEQLTWKRALFIGAAQALALIPGTSRSGITISSGLFSGLSREEAVRFSFLMGIPVIAGAGLFSLLDFFQQPGGMGSIDLAAALLLAFLSGLAAIHLLLKLISKRGLYFFGVYRILLAIVLLIFFV